MEQQGEFNTKRILIFMLIIAAAVITLISRLIYLQIYEGDKYLQEAQNRILRKNTITASRGEILDRMGRPLVTNRQGFSIFIDNDSLDKSKINDTMLYLLDVFEKSQESFYDKFPITQEPYEFSINDQELSDSRDYQRYIKSKKIDANATAQEVVEKLIGIYMLTDYSKEDIRKIIGIRYEMEIKNSTDSGVFELVSDINISTATRIREQNDKFSGVLVDVSTFRQYETPGLAGHILGRVGSIYAEEYQELKTKGYMLNDRIGKEGIEYTAEEYLRGKNGTRQVIKNQFGQVINDSIIDPVIPGNNVVLTIDKDLQALAENTLKVRTEQLIQTARQRNEVGQDATGGAIVAIEVKTGEILALANNPTIDMENFNANYESYRTDPMKPLINRAISAAYPPGSIFKMLTGISGLMSGSIGQGFSFNCTGVYSFSQSYNPSCWRKTAHGRCDMEMAIQRSCNCFFFEVGRQTGIEKINEYQRYFGFGELTGIELLGESKGTVAGPDALQNGEMWTSTDTIQSAIGQSLNSFTTLQLAGYIQALANDGKRYKPHLIKSVKDYHSSNTILDKQPELAEEIPISPQVMKTIKNGMERATNLGSISYVMKTCSVPVAGKTGTAQVPGGSSNATFICYAPMDDPQIAVAIMIEHGGEGSQLGYFAKDIIEQYFAQKNTGDTIVQDNILIP